VIGGEGRGGDEGGGDGGDGPDGSVGLGLGVSRGRGGIDTGGGDVV